MSDLDTFESDVVITEAPVQTDSTGGEVETFDNMEAVELPEGQGDKIEAKSDTEELKDKQINQLDDSKEEKKEDKEDEKEEDEVGDTKEADADGGPKEGEPTDKEDGPKVKMLKAKVGDDKAEIHPDAEIRVKVDGKRVDVPIQELISNYSGKTNWDKKYNELNTEKQEFQKENTQYKQELGWLQNNIKTVTEILDSDDKNPIDALMHLVDVTDRNPVQFQMKLFKHMQSQVEDMAEMDEVEQELYWERQKNNYLSKRQESLTTKAQTEKQQADQMAKVDSLREAQGVDEAQFMEAHSELQELGIENVTPEQAVNYAVMKPHLDLSESLIKPYEEDMTTDGADKLILELANYLKSGEFTESEIKKLLSEEYTSNSEVDDLKDKVKNFSSKSGTKPSKVADKGDDHVESFNDYDDQYYGRNL